MKLKYFKEMNLKGVEIIFEDNHILVVNKPSGILSQKDKTGDDSIIEILKHYIKIKYNKPGDVFLGSVHRLDRPTSGVMVFARTSKALTRLTTSLRNNEFNKRYLAILEGNVYDPQGKLSHYLVKDNRLNKVKAYKNDIQGSKKAELEFKVLNRKNDMSLLKVTLLTGRPHQIRTQFSKEYFPILGDIKYGSKKNFRNRSFYLHSFSLEFPHPTKKDLLIFKHLPNLDNFIWSMFKENLK